MWCVVDDLYLLASLQKYLISYPFQLLGYESWYTALLANTDNNSCNILLRISAHTKLRLTAKSWLPGSKIELAKTEKFFQAAVSLDKRVKTRNLLKYLSYHRLNHAANFTK